MLRLSFDNQTTIGRVPTGASASLPPFGYFVTKNSCSLRCLYATLYLNSWATSAKRERSAMQLSHLCDMLRHSIW